MARWQGRDRSDGGGFSDALRRVANADNPLGMSLLLFRVGGISVRLHIFFIIYVVIELLIAAGKGSVNHAATYLAIMFTIVLLHEFGHCLACRWVGGQADEILLWPLGGLAMCRPPHRWGASLVTTLGGPMVNVLLVPVSGLVVWATASAWDWGLLVFNPFDPFATWPVASLGSWVAVTAWWFYFINLVLLLFNMLLPMFPMDAGRVVQELLWWRLGYRRSMAIAVNLGLLIAVVVGLWAMSTGQGILSAIAIFAGLTCWQQRQQLRFLEADLAEDDPYGLFAPPARRDDAAAATRAEETRARQARAEREHQAELDRILAKIAKSGMASLSHAEKRFLQADTERRRSG
ncbi:MAG: hypothetical protein JNJ48_07990 [Phycisphaerae bacterium]|nr:hypothetical protein [Phycisphaerae bacterium]